MNKSLLVLPLLGLLVGCLSPAKDKTGGDSAATEAPADSVYLFSYFVGNGQDGLHLAYSEDGYTWQALNHGESLLTPTAGEDRLMRDPCIIRGPGGTFHMVWTVSWEERSIGYASSEDLINWSAQQTIPVMAHEPTAMNCWAPEIFYDQQEARYLIYWATTIPGRFPETSSRAEDKWNHRIYATTTQDFETFSPTELFFDQGFNVIDAVIAQHGAGYVMVVKDETKFPEAQKDLHITTSEELMTGYAPVSKAISDHWVEGPTIARVDSQWVAYFDRYRAHEMGAIASTDLVTWTDISDRIRFPEGVRHGTVLKVERAIWAAFQ
jgi:beta-xylosidase